MSNQLTLTSSFGQLIGDALSAFALVDTGVRSIDDIYPHIVAEEIHRDEMQITIHPVESGTPVTDHSYLMPQTVEIHCGWSNATAQTSGFAQAIYQALLKKQQSRQPMSLQTGKRAYTSMLLKSVGVKRHLISSLCVPTLHVLEIFFVCFFNVYFH